MVDLSLGQCTSEKIHILHVEGQMGFFPGTIVFA